MRQNTYLYAVGGLCVLLFTGGAIAQNAPAAQRTPTQKTAQSPGAAPAAARKPPMAVAHAADTSASEAQAAMVKQYCATCHSEKGKGGGLSLVDFDPWHATDQAEISEKIIRKLRAGMMPPPVARRPASDVLNDFIV